MTAITKSSTTPFESTAAEALLFEIAVYLRCKENIIENNPNAKKFVQITDDLNAFTTAISFSLPITQEINGTGQVITTATEYLTLPGISISGDGTFKATQVTQLFYEIITYLQLLEKNTTANPNGFNNVSASIDTDESVLSGSATLPIAITFYNGKPVINAKEYLL